MTDMLRGKFLTWQKVARHKLLGPQLIAFVPAFVLAGFWIGGEPTLLLTALGLPALVFFLGGFTPQAVEVFPQQSAPKPLISLAEAELWANKALIGARQASLAGACIMIDVQGFAEITDQQGTSVAETYRDLVLKRLANTLRREDIVTRLSDSRFVVLLAPALRIDLEHLMLLTGRLQNAVEEPILAETTTRFLSSSIGFCASNRLPNTAEGRDFIEAAQIALDDAMRNGPSTIRAWSENMNAAHVAQKALAAEVKRALANGQIQPWFQPQICTSTGRISGVEALARWIHPEKGIVAPGQFLRSLEEAGQMGKLGEVILQRCLAALRDWDAAGVAIPTVSVNFSTSELRDPSLVERVKWELDRYGLQPNRLGIEVLETVIADAPEGTIARNLIGLGKLGCQIDLDDFGTGHASITSLRRFPVNRIKIDRSFVTRIDRDEDQRRMLAAVLGMADRLSLATLAEGVETAGEHALLAQLGCDHVQGFGIARAMPADQLIGWSARHTQKTEAARNMGRNAG